MNQYDAELWTYMEWDFLAPREQKWRANWYEMWPVLRDSLNRLNEYESEGLPVTELSVAQAWLDRAWANESGTRYATGISTGWV